MAVKKRDLRMKYGFDMVICDESHYMKNHKTKRTRGLMPLIRGIDKALLLTGTPAPNRPSELFSQANMVRILANMNTRLFILGGTNHYNHVNDIYM